MTNFFEGNERSHRNRQVNERLEEPILARVVAVKERHPEVEERWEQGDSSRSNVVNDFKKRQYEVDLSAPHLSTADGPDGTKTAGERLRDVPVVVGVDGEAAVPEPGRDLALVVFKDGENKREPVVIGFHYHSDYFPPVARRGTWRLQKGDVCFEAYEERDRKAQDVFAEYARIAVQDGDEQNEKPEIEVAIKEKSAESGEYTVVIDGDGDTPTLEMDFEDGSIELLDETGAGIIADGDGSVTITGDNVTIDD